MNYEGSAVGLVTFPVDRFVGLDAMSDPEQTGPAELLTKPIRIDQPNLYLNAATKPGGSLRVELRNPDWSRIKSFEEPSRAICGDALNHPVQWESKDGLASLIGRDVRLVIHMEQASLHAMTFSDEALPLNPLGETQHADPFNPGAAGAHV